MDLTRLTDEVAAVSERYAYRHGFRRDDTWFLLKLQEEVGELTQAFLMRAGQARTKGRSPEELEQGFRDELADVLAHVLLMARHHDVDLVAALERKWLVWSRDRSVPTTGPHSKRPPGRRGSRRGLRTADPGRASEQAATDEVQKDCQLRSLVAPRSSS